MSQSYRNARNQKAIREANSYSNSVFGFKTFLAALVAVILIVVIFDYFALQGGMNLSDVVFNFIRDMANSGTIPTG